MVQNSVACSYQHGNDLISTPTNEYIFFLQ